MNAGRSRWKRVWWITLGVLGVVAVTWVAIRAGRDSDTAGVVAADESVTRSSEVRDVGTSPPLAADPHTAGLPGSAPDDSALVGGITNHLEFARRVATVLLAYDAGTDFIARNADLLRASSPTPYGDSAGLADDLEKFTPAEDAIWSLRSTDTRVSVTLSEVAVSDWAARTLAARGASSGVYGIDITGSQQISAAGATPIVVPVEMGVAVACPPAVAFCTLAGVVPQHLEDALAER